MISISSPERFWRARARWVAWRWNVACGLRVFLPVAIALSAALTGALLITRRAGGNPSLIWMAGGGLLVAGMLVSALAARRSFSTWRDALVRLEGVHQLHNRLTSAAAGVGAWPPPLERAGDGLRWRWSTILLPVAGAAALLLFAAFVPIRPGATTAGFIEAPASWTQLEQWIDTLKKEDVVQSEALETLQEQVAELRAQPSESWYSHSSLEASDNLRQQTGQSLRALERELQSASDALAAAGQMKTMSPELSAELNKRFADAIHGLELGTLPMNKELLGKLKDLDLSKVRQLTPEELATLKKCLQSGTKACKRCLGESDKEAEALVLVEGDQEGNGGITRGGGPADERYQEKPTDLGTDKVESVASDDLSRAALGDVLGVQQGTHEIDKGNYQGPVPAGAVQSQGDGGEAVWRNQLTPPERDLLQRFYK